MVLGTDDVATELGDRIFEVRSRLEELDNKLDQLGKDEPDLGGAVRVCPLCNNRIRRSDFFKVNGSWRAHCTLPEGEDRLVEMRRICGKAVGKVFFRDLGSGSVVAVRQVSDLVD